MNVAIIDDKIRSESILRYKTVRFYVDDDLEIEKLDGIGDSKKAITGDSHADICSKIIRKYNSDCSITNIIVKGSSTGDLEKFVSGLEFVSEMEEIDIVNLSIGFTDRNYAVELNHAIRKLLKRGIKIVAAYSNSGEETYPAAFDNVIGCRAAQNRMDRGYYKQNDVFFATGTHIIRLNSGTPFFTPNVNSYATAYITSLISNNIPIK